MSKFDEFMDTARKVAKKAVNETARVTDEAASVIKIKAEEAKLCEIYERLGKVAFDYFEAQQIYPENIAKVLDEITSAKTKIKSLQKELADKKEKYANKKAESEAKNEPVSEDGMKSEDEPISEETQNDDTTDTNE